MNGRAPTEDKERPLVLYHGGCNDGFCSAWVYRRCVTPVAEFHPVQYNEVPPPVRGRQVVMLDFTYPRPLLERILHEAASLFVIDHHATARTELEGLNCSLFAVDKSAARLTWEHYFDPRQQASVDCSPWLVDYTEDRDLWRWKLPDSQAVNAAISSYPRRFEVWDELARRGAHALSAEGHAILRYRQRLIGPHLRHHGWIRLGAYRIPVANVTQLGSEVANALAAGHPLAAVFFVKRDGRVVYNLRSRGPDAVDVGEIARAYGGGGHRHAAAFTVDALLPMDPASSVQNTDDEGDEMDAEATCSPIEPPYL